MGGYLWGIGLALLAAVGVIWVANGSSGNTDLHTFWRDLRSGLRPGRRRTDVPDDAEAVDVPLGQLFAEASEPDDGYLQLDELADMIERTGERAGKLLPGRAGGHPAAPAPPAQPHRSEASSQPEQSFQPEQPAGTTPPVGPEPHGAPSPSPVQARAGHAPRPGLRRGGHQPLRRAGATPTLPPPVTPPRRHDG